MSRQIPKIAAIDVGTNSFHMVIASVNRQGQLRIHSRDKDMVRLGESAGDMKHLSAEAIARGVKTMKRFILSANKEKAVIRAIATSAVREAINRDDFVRAVEQETGVRMEVVSGQEEGRLVYLGVIHALPIHDKQVLVCDIGGGSTETTIGRNGMIDYVHSEKLGTLRLMQRFFLKPFINNHDIDDCRAYIHGAWSPTYESIKQTGYDTFVGTSGTMQTIARMVLARKNRTQPEIINGVTCSRSDVMSVIHDIVTARHPSVIATLSGVDAKRADILLAGALLVEHIMNGVDAQELLISGYALREGIVFDAVQKEKDIQEFHHLAHLRFETVESLCHTYHADWKHASHVADLSIQIFDQLAGIHGLGDNERELLEAAAYLHDIGYHISPDMHHKHSYYIIRNSVMPGFTNDELEIIANIARYHRKSHPKKKHYEFMRLPESTRRVILVLSAILRIAEGFDRRRNQCVESLRVTHNGSSITMMILNKEKMPYPDIEMWGAERRKTLMEEIFSTKVVIE
ncbi:MAG: Ppx/GppA family phosphatase [Candidatus Kapabacteria bacterium]|nr:Ppx/GppA family phosphatase [Candidatus Kapabacteria bacterium]